MGKRVGKGHRNKSVVCGGVGVALCVCKGWRNVARRMGWRSSRKERGKRRVALHREMSRRTPAAKRVERARAHAKRPRFTRPAHANTTPEDDVHTCLSMKQHQQEKMSKPQMKLKVHGVKLTHETERGGIIPAHAMPAFSLHDPTPILIQKSTSLSLTNRGLDGMGKGICSKTEPAWEEGGEIGEWG